MVPKIGWGTINFVKDIDNRPGKYIFLNFLVDVDAPLEEQSRCISVYINRLMEMQNCTRVNLIGISKGGRMASKILSYIENRDIARQKLNVAAYSMTGKGTIFASPLEFNQKLHDLVKELRPKLLEQIILALNNILFTKNDINEILAERKRDPKIQIHQLSFFEEVLKNIYVHEMKRSYTYECRHSYR